MANHRSHILLFIAFALHFKVTDFPVGQTNLLSFGEFLLRTYTAPKSVLNVLSSVRRFHVELNLSPEVFDSLKFARWKRALFLTVRTCPMQALPLPFPLLERLVGLARALGGEGRAMAGFLTVAFHALARASTLLARSATSYDVTRLPTLADVTRMPSGFSLLLKWDKTHQVASQAFSVPLLRGGRGSTACPVRAVELLLQAAEGRGRDTPLFATASGRAGGTRTSLCPLTIGRAREWLRILLAALGQRPDAYTLHSLRRGGCTLASVGGAAVSDLQALGGWRSEAVHLYHSQFEARRRAAQALRGAASHLNEYNYLRTVIFAGVEPRLTREIPFIVSHVFPYYPYLQGDSIVQAIQHCTYKVVY